MIRIQTSRGGWRDIYTSSAAGPDLLDALPQPGRLAYREGDVLYFRVAAADGDQRRPDSVWLLMTARSGSLQIATAVAMLLNPQMRDLARYTLEAPPPEADRAEHELAAVASSLDLLSNAPGAQGQPASAAANFWQRMMGRSLARQLIACLLGTTAIGLLWFSLVKLGNNQSTPSGVSLDAGSLAAIKDLSTKLSTPLPPVLDDNSVNRVREAILAPLAAQYCISTDRVRVAVEEALQNHVFYGLGYPAQSDIDRVVLDVLKRIADSGITPP